jgi:hypothetical protein
VRRFWLFQAAGWSAYYVAMTFSRVGRFPLRYMATTMLVQTLLGLGASLLLWRAYRRLAGTRTSLPTQIAIAAALSYLAGLGWTVTANLADHGIAQVLFTRPRPIAGTPELFFGAVYNAFTLLAWSVLYFVVIRHEALVAAREDALRAEAAASRARLEALRYQLQPHLLFNTLNGISTLVVEQRTAEASRMISRLSDFLRLILASPNADLVPLATEIDLVERYLEIEQARFGDRLSVTVLVEPDAWSGLVPSLLLQPLVENAIQHGISPAEGSGSIRVEAVRVGSRLRLAVIDRAAGPPAPRGESAGGRIGLANVRERLERLFPRDFDLVSLTADQGTDVVLDLPFRAEGR